tara:strand:- start:870 stop:1640 length:771 start_codon:yes stop_codon:yes gene_type:complete
MTILSVETATSVQSVAVVGENGLCATEAVTQPRSLATAMDRSRRWSIMPAIDRLLNAIDMTLSDIDGFAVSIGPGSFTGLRVGLATMKGLAYGANKPLIAVPTLHALAVNVAGIGLPICTVLDAKRGELFVAIWHTQQSSDEYESLVCVMEPLRLPIEHIGESLSSHMQDTVIVVGDGVSLCRQMISEQFGKRVVFPAAIACFPSAMSVAYVGKERLARGMLADGELAPIYLRPPDAKPNLPHRAVESSTSFESEA